VLRLRQHPEPDDGVVVMRDPEHRGRLVGPDQVHQHRLGGVPRHRHVLEPGVVHCGEIGGEGEVDVDVGGGDGRDVHVRDTGTPASWAARRSSSA